MNMRFGTWNSRSLYSTGSLKIETRDTGKLDLVGAEEVRWDKGGIERAEGTLCSRDRRMGSSVRNRFFVHKGITSAVRRVEFISHAMTNIVLSGRWCNMPHVRIEVKS
jgi:hypothetical protein